VLYILPHVLMLFIVDPKVKAEQDRRQEAWASVTRARCVCRRRGGRRVRHAWEWDRMRSW